MKTKMMITAVSVLLASTGVQAQQMAGAGAACKIVLKAGDLTAADQAAMAFRAATTHTDSNSAYARTSVAREQFLKTASDAMIKFMTDETDTPEMVFAGAEGVKIEVPAISVQNPSKNDIPLTYMPGEPKQGYHYEKVPQVKITGLGPDGILAGTLLLPVSAHTGLADAKKWSTTDKYTVVLETPGSGPYAQPTSRVILVKDVLSLGLITSQEVSMKLVPGQTYQIAYYRLGLNNGLGAPGGYPNGRLLQFVWDGK